MFNLIFSRQGRKYEEGNVFRRRLHFPLAIFPSSSVAAHISRCALIDGEVPRTIYSVYKCVTSSRSSVFRKSIPMSKICCDQSSCLEDSGQVGAPQMRVLSPKD